MENNYIEVSWGTGKINLSGLSNDKVDDILNFLKANYIKTNNSADHGQNDIKEPQSPQQA